MPFDKNFDDIYQSGIKESCTQAGAYCERVDEQDYHGTILERIYNQIDKADFIVADITGQNPNVFYEVGYAHIGEPCDGPLDIERSKYVADCMTVAAVEIGGGDIAVGDIAPPAACDEYLCAGGF